MSDNRKIMVRVVFIRISLLANIDLFTKFDYTSMLSCFVFNSKKEEKDKSF